MCAAFYCAHSYDGRMKIGAAIQDAINLASRFKEGETFRPYVLKRLWLVVPAVAFFLALSVSCAAATVVAFASVRTWLALPGLVLAPAVLVGSLFLQLYVFFSWLEDRALYRALGREPAHNRPLALLPAVPPVLAVAVLVVPLALLAAVAPVLAGVLIVLEASTPFLYAYLDRG